MAGGANLRFAAGRSPLASELQAFLLNPIVYSCRKLDLPRVPVVARHGRKDVLVGIVSRGDVIRALIYEDDKPR